MLNLGIHATLQLEVSRKIRTREETIYFSQNDFSVLDGYSVTLKGCFRDTQGTWDDGQCQDTEEGGVKVRFCVCKTDLCNDMEVNGVDKIFPSIGFLLLSLIASYLK